ncbi:hypothetical protein [Rheinheimera sp. UJ63]|uniref:hypothetical protein n=1 Tax=Rheinheimera sp. UJ63 TaxID=2910157 RepID=UPI001F20FEC8|nr:hypothetical protein [Rheinheimera sp. UJ63]MCF4010667.1 hypothetical protein [Rheinheimera sp. UJ63]
MLRKHFNAFLSNKLIIYCSVIGTILLGLLEHYITGSTSDLIKEASMGKTAQWFFLINLLSYLLFAWASSQLIARTIDLAFLSIRTVLLSLAKAFICTAWWCYVGIWLLKQFIQYSSIELTGFSVLSLSIFGQIGTALIVCLLVCYCYSMFISIYIGSILRTALRGVSERNRRWFARYHVPVSCVWVVFNMPLLWLILAGAFFLKLSGLLLLSVGVSFIYLITEPLAMLAVLFSFYIALVVYLDEQKNPNWANLTKRLAQ